MQEEILVTGANGFVGQALCETAARRGFCVKGAVRAACNLPTVVEPATVGAVDAETDWGAALRNVGIVIHLAARVHVMSDTAADPLTEFLKVNLHGTANLARQAAQAGVKRLVYVSSIKVNGEETRDGQKFSEAGPPAPQDFYAVSKWKAEQALQRIAQETGLEVVVVRPPLVYGPGVKGNFAQMLNVVARRIPLPFASVRNSRSLIYVGNLVDALIACATYPAAAGQTYLVCDGEDISTPDLLRQLAAGTGVSSCLLPCPPALLRLAGKLTGKSQQLERLLGSLQIDSDKICRELGWRPPYTLADGLRTVATTNHETSHLLNKK
ncbi:MAG: SDR family oxidoreductase [Nitrosomonadales bacterium]|nr:SDR family oxidoreductase [Nitrosomonadales bacterium]